MMDGKTIRIVQRVLQKKINWEELHLVGFTVRVLEKTIRNINRENLFPLFDLFFRLRSPG